MKYANIRRASARALAAAIGLALGNIASAGLNIDVRVTGLSGGGAVVNNKLVTDVIPGSVVRFDVFAVVTGTNAILTDDKFVADIGSFRSSPFGVRGDLLMGLVPTIFDSDGNPISAGWDGPGSSIGLQQDLDGDGDLDVGSNNEPNATFYWSTRSPQGPIGSTAGSFSPTTGGRRVGFGTFTVTLTSPISTFINWDDRQNAPGAAFWYEDGVGFVHEEAGDGLVPIEVRGIPEPACTSLVMGASTLAIGARLRRRLLRTR